MIRKLQLQVETFLGSSMSGCQNPDLTDNQARCGCGLFIEKHTKMTKESPSQDRINWEFTYLFEADAAYPREILARFTIILSSAVVIWYVTNSWISLVWGIGYVACNSLYVHRLQSVTLPLSKTGLFFFLSASAFIATLFSAMVGYIATLGEGNLIILAICGCCGLGLHTLGSNTRLCYASYIDLAATMLTTVCVFAIAATQAGSPLNAISLLVGGMSIMGYFALTFFEIIAMRENLKSRMATETQSEKMRALGQLSSGVAHDFNNLLTIIGGNIELAQLNPKDKDQGIYLDEAKLASDRGAALVRNLLAFVHKSRVQVARCNGRDVLSRVDSLLARILPAHIELKVIPLDQDAPLEIDQSMLENAILNLVINARDAIAAQPGTIIVKAGIAAEGDVLVITVEDSGPGMDDIAILEATEPFFTTKPIGEGSGLGLSMVKGFTEQSGGVFEITNCETRGICASIRIPIVQ